MKTKKSTIEITIMTLLSLIFINAAISQDVIKNLSRSNLPEAAMKCLQKAPGHFTLFPGQSDNDLALLKKSANTVNNTADTVFRYSINNGNEKIVYSYDQDRNLLTTLGKMWVIDEWANSTKVTNTFDANGNMITETAQNWQNNAWINYKMITHTYDGAGNCLKTTGQNWIGGAWVYWGQSDYTWDGSGNMLTELYQQWDSNSSAWVNNTLDSCTYDGNGNLLTFLDLQWDGMSFTNSMLETYSYDGTGNFLTHLTQFWDGAAWQDGYMETNTYDGNGNKITNLGQMWDGIEWMNDYMDTNTYDVTGNRLSYINRYCYDGVEWTNYSCGTFTYDANRNMLTSIYQFWQMNNWKNTWRAEYNYQAGLITGEGFTWAGTAWTAGDAGVVIINFNDNGNKINFYNGFNAVQVLVYYSTFKAGIDNHAEDPSGLVTVYPNPATDHLTVIPLNPKVKIEKLQLFDLAGNEQQITFSGNRVDLGYLQCGLYFLRLTTKDGQTVMKKIVKL